MGGLRCCIAGAHDVAMRLAVRVSPASIAPVRRRLAGVLFDLAVLRDIAAPANPECKAALLAIAKVAGGALVDVIARALERSR